MERSWRKCLLLRWSCCVTFASLGPLVEHYHGTLTGLGVDFDPAELRRGVDAAYEINAVLQLLTLTVFEGQGDNTGSEMADLWLPRVAAGLTHTW